MLLLSPDFDQCLHLVNRVKLLCMLAFCMAEKSSFTEFWQALFGRIVGSCNGFSIVLQTFRGLRELVTLQKKKKCFNEMLLQ